MKSGENDKQAAGRSHVGAPADPAKAPYRSPALREFGAVRDLTKGSGGTKSDGIMVNKA